MATLGGSSRAAGVDLARGVALLGIMAVHIFPALGHDGSVHPAFLLDSGRAPALFPVLAGVGLALGHGGVRPPTGIQLWTDRAGIVARAAVLIGLGLLLGRVDSPPLVILVHFGFLFLAATLFLQLAARHLWLLAGLWVLAAPAVSFAVRTGPAGVAGSPALPAPVTALQPIADLFLASTYPVLLWLAYLLVGMAIGRSRLDHPPRPIQLIVGGVGVAVTSKALSHLLLAASGGPEALSIHREGLEVFAPDMTTQLRVGLLGTTPTTDWRWLLVSAPHSSTTFDLLHTGGSAVAILGLCLLLVRRFGRRPFLPLVAVGSMTLTLYTAHVLALWRGGPLLLDDELLLYVVQVSAALAVALVWRTHVGRGPLEALSTWSATRAGSAFRWAVTSGAGSRKVPG